MNDYLSISLLNDFFFCPYSIYLHNVYMESDESQYHAAHQKTTLQDPASKKCYAKTELFAYNTLCTKSTTQKELLKTLNLKLLIIQNTLRMMTALLSSR